MIRRDLGRGAWIEVHEDFVPDDAALLDRLVATLPLQTETLHLFGRAVTTPRLTSWHGDPGCHYRYSGRTFDPEPWTEDLRTVRDQLTAAFGLRFNSVLVNYYRSGADSMGAHSDDEPELGPEHNDVRIASVSLGARRRFVLLPRHRGDERRSFDLGGGDLLIMGGTTQRHFRHAVPKARPATGSRLNLTFRFVCSLAEARTGPTCGEIRSNRGSDRKGKDVQ